MARFEREANILKQLKHPHIVRLYATGAYRKTPFIAMEFIDGEALDRVLARRGRLGWEEVVAYGKQLCEALQYAHEKGIIHRDLKPSNLMITREGMLKLTDFGIAKDTDVTALTGHNSTIGTAAYMSPEQCKGDKNLTNKSDLYSLGIVFYELLTGKKPFYADTTVDMFLKHVNEPAAADRQAGQRTAGEVRIAHSAIDGEGQGRPADRRGVGRCACSARSRRTHSPAEARASSRRHRSGRIARGICDGSKLDDSDRDAAACVTRQEEEKEERGRGPTTRADLGEGHGHRARASCSSLAGAYYALRPASPERLVAAIDSADSPEAKIETAEKYLDHYGEQPGELTDRATKAFREGHVNVRERQIAARRRSNMIKPFENDDAEAYRLAWEALEFEEKGNLSNARGNVAASEEQVP